MSITLTEETTAPALFERDSGAGRDYRRAMLAEAASAANATGKPCEVYSHDGIVLMVVEPDPEPSPEISEAL